MEKDTGRKKCVYGRGRPRSLRHDVKVTDLAAFAYPVDSWTRGVELPRNADAILERNDRTYFVELETGSMSPRRVRDKFERSYVGCMDTVLVIALDGQYLEKIMAVSEIVESVLFGILDEIIADPEAPVWRTPGGTKRSIDE